MHRESELYVWHKPSLPGEWWDFISDLMGVCPGQQRLCALPCPSACPGGRGGSMMDVVRFACGGIQGGRLCSKWRAGYVPHASGCRPDTMRAPGLCLGSGMKKPPAGSVAAAAGGVG